MPKSRIMIQLEPETIEQVDKIRGAVPRAAWVRLLIEDRLNGADRIQAEAREATEQAIRSVITSGPASDAVIEELRKEKPLQNWGPDDWAKASRKVRQASVAQRTEHLTTNQEAAGSTPARRAGKGSPATQGQSEGSADPQQQIRDAPYKTKSPSLNRGRGSPGSGVKAETGEGSRHVDQQSPSRKPKACKHTNQIRKLGRPYCTDCGEFV